MDVKSYCDTVAIELTGWKAKLYDVIRRSEKMTGDDKESVDPMVAELITMVDDLDERIAALARECPAEWSDHKSAIDGKMSKVNDKWKEVWGVMGEKEYGIGGA
ncbi:MAG: hypothetical protein JSV83_01380 [Desulfobacterales bacterium]|nr:MAG: hypothetical protein JSV83_01380 [Desulfobacterales bacterium]